MIAVAAALLAYGGAAELATPDDKSLIEQSGPLEVGQKRGHGLGSIGLRTQLSLRTAGSSGRFKGW